MTAIVTLAALARACDIVTLVTGGRVRRAFARRGCHRIEGVDNREWSHMPVLEKSDGPVTVRDVWLFAATSVAFIFIMMITAGLIGQLLF